MNLAETLNLQCRCETLQRPLVVQSLGEQLAQTHPHLFSAAPVFISSTDAARVAEAVAALHRVAALPGWQEAATAGRDAAARVAHGPQGAFMGYDFHLGESGPRLIEINTNAGGAFLHAVALRAHEACCSPFDAMFDTPTTGRDELDDAFMAMFRAEWRSQRGDAPWRTVLIVDDDPAGQYLAPEFELARRLFERHGLRAAVADARELQWEGGRLWHPALPGEAVDLVYNRATDFDLLDPAHAALRAAYLSGAAVVTPHPHAHAVHADKRNLVTLGDEARLAAWGASEADLATIRAVVPRTRPVTPESADSLWAERRRLFFKPDAGYGSKGTYRGDKLTRRVWEEIAAGGYVAQEFVAPSERLVGVGGEDVRLKLDVRAYAYAGQVLVLAARVYAGQTTNFRTPGGGFAAVVVVPDGPGGCDC
jgi:hypothetical protein